MLKALQALVPTTFTLIGSPQIDPYYKDDVNKSIKNVEHFSVKDPSLFIFHDFASQSASGRPLFVFSIFETSQLLPSSINMLKNGPCDIILTTTKEHKIILDNLNLGKPVFVINEGVDPKLFNTNERKQFFDTKKFTFLLMGKREKRKNTDITFKILLEECMYKETTIICHTYNPFLAGKVEKVINQWCGTDPAIYGLEYKGFNKNCHTFSNQMCTVIFTTPEFKVQELQYLYKSANVGICCSSGEGFNLPLAESMACGIPVITTNCLGHKAYLPNINNQKDLIIDCIETEEAIDNIWFKKGQGFWSKVRENDIRDKVKYVLDNQNKYEKLDEDLSKYMHTNFSWTKAALEYTNLVKQSR
jgi:glycosyltransferase involved in cell wall biosynthesis